MSCHTSGLTRAVVGALHRDGLVARIWRALMLAMVFAKLSRAGECRIQVTPRIK